MFLIENSNKKAFIIRLEEHTKIFGSIVCLKLNDPILKSLTDETTALKVVKFYVVYNEPMGIRLSELDILVQIFTTRRAFLNELHS